ncbi:MAG TPA: universal stress protein [Methylomirabilota bacterium]|nr:universal stress protein [Methylomirabilota bacterium]
MTLLCPTDFSECADAAQAVAARLARRLQADLVLLHVAVEAPLYHEGWASTAEVRRVFEIQRQWAKDTLDDRATEIHGTGVTARGAVVDGVAHEAIVAEAERLGAEMIVMGTHGRGGLARFLLGSVADRVIRLAPCPVLTVRGPRLAEPAPPDPVTPAR